MKAKNIPLLARVLIIHVIFMLLFNLYDWFPSGFTAIFSGINESVYQHMKVCFFSYILFVLIEYLIVRKSIKKADQYFYSRLLSATYFPLVMLVIYLLGPLVFGHIENIVFEIIFANISLLATSFATLIVEKQVSSSKPSITFKIVAIILFLLSLAQFIVYTYELPWYDIFALPPGY